MSSLSPTQIQEWLASSRNSVPLMDPDLLIDSSIEKKAFDPLDHPFDREIFERAKSASIAKDKILVFDLDDTLLNTNYYCQAEWLEADPLNNKSGSESIDYSSMRKPITSLFKNRKNKPKRLQHSSKHYPFLSNADVIAQLRPGALALLLGLKEAGARLILASMSAQSRIDFIFKRIPSLAHIFEATESKNVFSAEDLLLGCYSINQSIETISPHWADSLTLHKSHQQNIALKTPLLIHILSGLDDYALLIDDSEETAKRFATHSLSNKLLFVSAKAPHTGYTSDILEGILGRLTSTHSAALQKLPVNHQTFAEKDTYPFLRFEDPLYFPLIHLHDRIIPLLTDEK